MDSIGLYLSSDSDEGDNSAAIRYRQVRDKSDIFQLPDRTILGLFRLPKAAVNYLLKELDDALPKRARATSIPNVIKIAAMLRFVAQGSYQQSVGQDFLIGMSQSTVSETMGEVFTEIENRICAKWILFRQSDGDKQLAANCFFGKTGFPGVISCVDGTHVNIVRPTDNEHLYFNRKGKHSVNTMIACDHKMRIMAVDARYGGASHGSLVWSLSSYRQHLQRRHTDNSNYWLLGDSGYPLEPWLITPFRATADGSREASFNSVHSKTRNIVERCIGLLKARFRCLLGARELHYTPKKAAQIINVCAMLHNMCLYYNVSNDLENETTVDEDSHGENYQESNEPDNIAARRTRQNILNSIT